jgi:FkbM family methyltransferase
MFTNTDLERYINPLVMGRYRFTGKIWKAVRNLDALVFHRDRFDLMAKLAYGDAYLTGSVNGWRIAQYRAHIRAFNNLDENDGTCKHAEERFLDTFHRILRAEVTDAPCSLNVIPVNERQMILDGSHRLARAYLRREPVHLVHFEDAHQNSYDYQFFYKQRLDVDVADSLAFEYGSRNAAAHCLIFFPSAARRIRDISRLLIDYFEIFYHKEIRWTERAPHNVVAALYCGEPWLGSFTDGFAAAALKYMHSFNLRQPAQFYIVSTHPGVNIVEAKQELRHLIGEGDHSLHTSVNDEEKIQIMRLFLNNNTLHWVNNARPYYPKYFINLLNDYHQSGGNSLNACLTGSAVYAAYGIRDVGDLDYITARPLMPFVGGQANDEYLAPFLRRLGLDVRDILEDPRYHFHYFGYKVMTVRLCLRFKMGRKETKDLVDLARVIAFRTVNIFRDTISHFTWPVWVGRDGTALGRGMRVLVRWTAKITHAMISRGPKSIAGPYLNVLSFISRGCPRHIGTRINNSVSQYTWPSIQFAPKTVSLAGGTKISVVPHLGEFDQAALFTQTLDYETPVFEWLERAPLTYDLVIEIGANVGIYAVFLDSLTKRVAGSKLAKIIAFEPSWEAFRGLLENLRLNNVQHVVALQAPVDPTTGPRPFFEPGGHLANGRFVCEFAESFADTIADTPVVAFAALELEKFLSDAGKALIKIDTERSGPGLVAALAPSLRKYRPDLLIKVHEDIVEQLEETPALRGYRKFLITSGGLREAKSLFASPDFRDWVFLFE